ncbi:S9 family peptidase [uncultured Kocuria sp.]|uniref:alpha/beta hydrolase family protein n=1 Tax=uncultured Kocuria sp. TaxID=259305 RepID=UPI00262DDC7B|nr:alpha/beta hydrolase [uncultured Kocuria sp.]
MDTDSTAGHRDAAVAEQETLRGLLARPEPPDTTLAYGPAADHVVDVFRPTALPRRALLLLHGGYWRRAVDRTHATPLARELARRGHLVLVPEYRRGSGACPATLEDMELLSARLPRLLERAGHPETAPDLPLTVAGHSAGGHLALWWGISGLGHGAGPVPRIRALAPVADLTRGAREGIGEGAVVDFMGGTPEELPEAYAHADPAARWPEAPADRRRTVRALHGDRDRRVPVEHTTDSPVESVIVRGAHHFDVVDPASAHWPAVLEFLET